MRDHFISFLPSVRFAASLTHKSSANWLNSLSPKWWYPASSMVVPGTFVPFPDNMRHFISAFSCYGNETNHANLAPCICSIQPSRGNPVSEPA